jgi:hypothetical protein
MVLLLIYDDTCPLCAWYSNQFVKLGFLQNIEKKPFSALNTDQQALLDMQRAVNEIPLLNTHTKKVLYGIDALVEVLSRKIAFIKPIASLAPINFLLRFLYKLISYNRKGIVANNNLANGISCVPDYHTGYKMTFNFLLFIFNTAISFLDNSGVLLIINLVSGFYIGAASLLLFPFKIILESFTQLFIILLVCTIIALPSSYLPSPLDYVLIGITVMVFLYGCFKRGYYIWVMRKMGWL